MSADDDESGNEEQQADPEPEFDEVEDPQATAVEVLDEAITAIEESADGSAADRYAAEAEAVDTFTRRIGELVGVHGLPEHEVGPLAGSLSEETGLTNKTDIKTAIEEHVEGYARGGDGVGAALNEYLSTNVENIEVVRSTDATQSALYRWHFDDPNVGEFDIETGEGAAPHYQAFAIRVAIFDVVGIWTAQPIKPLRDSAAWANWISPFIAERSTEVLSKGARTVSIEAIANYIARSTAYPSIEAMLDRHGVRIDDDPEDGDPSEIWVPYEEVAQIAEDHGITPRALQVEAEARGLTTERLGGGVSESTFVNNEKVSYWVLSPTIADPRDYEPNPETPTERIERVMAEGDSEDGESPTSGVIGSTKDLQAGEGARSDGGEIDE